MRRRWAASEAIELGRGGVSCVAKATGMSRTTVLAGVREMKDQEDPQTSVQPRIRRPGGGRKKAEQVDSALNEALDALIDPVSRGHPESPLRWTCKSTRQLANELCRRNHPVSARTVARLLYAAGYSLQANRKTREGQRSSRPRCTVRAHQSTGATSAKARPAGDLDRHEKEGIDRGFQECRTRMATEAGAAKSSRPRLQG